MVLLKIGSLILILTILNVSFGKPGHHVHHRIHVPTKIKTIYHTKIIKIPEHHHYFHEKEKPKFIKVPEHHHYFHEKEQEKFSDHHEFTHKEDELDNYQNDYENEHKNYDFDDSHHSIYKKHAPARLFKRKKH